VKNYQIRNYQKEDFALWNDFIDKAKNATFLFHRNFMEYHSDRFVDYSLLIFNEEKLVAVFPANRVGDEVFSHQGLTYGGIVFSFQSKVSEEEKVLNELIDYLKEKAIKILKSNYCPFFTIRKQAMKSIIFFIKKEPLCTEKI
jgi:hypothetical protein